MTHFPHELPVFLLRPLGWALLHSLWQIALIVLLYQAFALATRGRSPRLRYAIGCLALAACVVAPVATFLTLAAPASDTYFAAAPGIEAATERLPASAPAATAMAHLPAHEAADPLARVATTADARVAWLVPAWALGVIVGLAGLLHAWRAVIRLRRTATRGAVPRELQAALARLGERLGVRQPVQLLLSERLDSPALIGWWRPVILLPRASAALPRSRIEPVLAHELAHVRRHDYPAALLQAAVGRLLFFHPGIHWLLRQLRAEREGCCDDLAARCCEGGPLAYARALTVLEASRSRVPALGVAEGDLLTRVRRLVDPAGLPRRRPALALLLAGLCLATAGFGGDLLARSDAAIVLDGHDPVHLLGGRHVPGQAELAVEVDGYRYLFADTATRESFLEDTWRYTVRNVAICAATGRRVLPDAYRVIDGHIVLFCCPHVGRSARDAERVRAMLANLPAPPTD